MKVEFFSVFQAAQILNTSHDDVKGMIADGQLEAEEKVRGEEGGDITILYIKRASLVQQLQERKMRTGRIIQCDTLETIIFTGRERWLSLLKQFIELHEGAMKPKRAATYFSDANAFREAVTRRAPTVVIIDVAEHCASRLALVDFVRTNTPVVQTIIIYESSISIPTGVIAFPNTTNHSTIARTAIELTETYRERKMCTEE